MSYFGEIEEEPDNLEQKCLCVLVLDTSGSMADPEFTIKPIDQLNKGLRTFQEEIRNNYQTSQRLEICLISFNHRVNCIQPPSLVDNFDMPTLQASGTTKIADAINEAIKKVEERKQWYKKTTQPYYRPWIILITDGSPDQDQDIKGISQKIRKNTEEKNFVFYAIGVEGADMNILKTISPPNMPPAKLKGLKFSEFFEWLSSSLSKITESKAGDKINFDSRNSWDIGFEV